MAGKTFERLNYDTLTNAMDIKLQKITDFYMTTGSSTQTHRACTDGLVSGNAFIRLSSMENKNGFYWFRACCETEFQGCI
jgi:hypothetical protein